MNNKGHNFFLFLPRKRFFLLAFCWFAYAKSHVLPVDLIYSSQKENAVTSTLRFPQQCCGLNKGREGRRGLITKSLSDSPLIRGMSPLQTEQRKCHCRTLLRVLPSSKSFSLQ